MEPAAAAVSGFANSEELGEAWHALIGYQEQLDQDKVASKLQGNAAFLQRVLASGEDCFLGQAKKLLREVAKRLAAPEAQSEAVRLEKRNAVLKALKEALTLLEAHGGIGCYDRADVIEEAKAVAKDVLRILDARAAELLAAPPEGEGAGGGDGNADPDPDPDPDPGDGGGAGEESEDEDLSTRRDRLVCEAECGSEAVLSDSDDAGQSEHGEPDTEAAVTRQQSQAAEGEGEGEEEGGEPMEHGEPEPAAATRRHFLAGGIGPALVQSVHNFLDSTPLGAHHTPSGITLRDVMTMLLEEHNAVRGQQYSKAWLRHTVDSYQDEAIAAAFAPLQEPGALHHYANNLWELVVETATSPPPGYQSFEAKCTRVAYNFLSTISGVMIHAVR